MQSQMLARTLTPGSPRTRWRYRYIAFALIWVSAVISVFLQKIASEELLQFDRKLEFTSYMSWETIVYYPVCIVGDNPLLGAVLAERYTSELKAKVLMTGDFRRLPRVLSASQLLGVLESHPIPALTKRKRVKGYLKNLPTWDPDTGVPSILGRLRSSPLLTMEATNATESYRPVCNMVYILEPNKTYTFQMDSQESVINATLRVFKPGDIIDNIGIAIDIFTQDTGIEYDGGHLFGKTHDISSGRLVAKNLRSYAGDLDAYQNLPVTPFDHSMDIQIQQAYNRRLPPPVGLRHRAYGPTGRDTIIGLAAYKENMDTWRTVVGSLRNHGFEGHFLFGVHPEIPPEEEEYLKSMNVTYYTVELVECEEGAGEIRENLKSFGAEMMRGVCPRGLEDLKLEWARFAMAKQWLEECSECTGWSLFIDTRDILFQRNPFTDLPNAEEVKEDLWFMEEISAHSNPRPEDSSRAVVLGDSKFYKSWTRGCYGDHHWETFYQRPMLCAGTVLGTRSGMMRFLSVLVDEFYSSNKKNETRCKSPHSTDQGILNYLYYMGRFGNYQQTRTLPWGTGPVNTMGKACVNKGKHSADDLILLDDMDRIVNVHETNTSSFRIPAILHQYDRCHKWIRPWIRNNQAIFRP